jgi:hypothetical protein
MTVLNEERPKRWIIVAPNVNPEQSEELVLTMQGIITHKMLPPFLEHM